MRDVYRWVCQATIWATVCVMGCKSAAGEAEQAAMPRSGAGELSQARLATFLKTQHFDAYGGEVSSRYIDLDGVAPRELLVEVRCDPGFCQGEFHQMEGSRYFLYSLSTSPESPELLTRRPLWLAKESRILVADVTGDGHADLILNGHGIEGARVAIVYDVQRGKSTTIRDPQLSGYTTSHAWMDVDGDGIVDLVTARVQPRTTPPDRDRSDRSFIATQLLGDAMVEVWSLAKGEVEQKRLGVDGVRQKLALSGEDVKVSELAHAVLVTASMGEPITRHDGLGERFMARYDEILARDIRLDSSFGSYLVGKELQFIDSEHDEMHVLLAALRQLGQQADISAWSLSHAMKTTSATEFSVHLELALSAASPDERDVIATGLLDAAFAHLIAETMQSPSTWHAIDPRELYLAMRQRRHRLTAAYLLSEDVEFEGKVASIRRFIREGIHLLPHFAEILTRDAYVWSVAPHLLDIDVSGESAAHAALTIDALGAWLSAVYERGESLSDTQKRQLDAMTERLFAHRDIELARVVDFILHHVHSPAMQARFARVMRDARAKIERGDELPKPYDKKLVASMLPLSVGQLDEQERVWWFDYLSREYGHRGEVYTSFCDMAISSSEEHIDSRLSYVEHAPEGSGVRSACLESILYMYRGAPPLSAERSARLLAEIDAVLQHDADEDKLLSLLEALDGDERLPDVKPGLWRVARGRKTGSARYKALALLANAGDEGAIEQITVLSRDIFSLGRAEVALFVEELVDTVDVHEHISLILSMMEHEKIDDESLELLCELAYSFDFSDATAERLEAISCPLDDCR